MDKLGPIFHVLIVFLGYAALGWWVVTIRSIHRTGVLKGSFGVATVAAIAGIITPVILLVLVLTRTTSWGTFGAYEVILLAALVVVNVLLPPLVPQQRKERREDTRQTTLHLVLLTGAVIFMIPFVWLLSTSFKDDEDIFTEHLTLIPQRPVTQMFNGQLLQLVHVDGVPSVPGQKNGLWAKVTEDDADAIVKPILAGSALGPERKVSLDNVHKVKKPGLVWENYPGSLVYLPAETHEGLIYVWNTLFVTLMSIIGTMLTASMVAYAFARLQWPGRDALFILLLATMMLPYAVTMIPQFLIWQHLGFVDTLLPLYAGAFMGGGAFNIFLLRQFFMTIPTELEEAAKIDGCGYWRIFGTIMMPLVRPALATVAIFTFMGSWNNFLGPLIYISSPTKMTVAYALQLYQSVHASQTGYLMAASVMVMLPVLAVFFFCQRYFIQGITLTGLKG